MDIRSNTILISQATAGIGLALAVAFYQLGNKVIICGCNEERLNAVKNRYHFIDTVRCNISCESDLIEMADMIQSAHPDLNILVNNAGEATEIELAYNTDLCISEDEIMASYIAPVKLITLMLPFLLKRQNTAIINISLGNIYTDFAKTPYYSASRAALQTYTMALRRQLCNHPIRVIGVFSSKAETFINEHFSSVKIQADEFLQKIINELKEDKH